LRTVDLEPSMETKKRRYKNEKTIFINYNEHAHCRLQL